MLLGQRLMLAIAKTRSWNCPNHQLHPQSAHPVCLHRTQSPCWLVKATADDRVEFTYQSADGRRKATMVIASLLEKVAMQESARAKSAKHYAGMQEKVFSPDNPLEQQQPWQFSWQMNERALVWSDDLKARLVKRVIGTELGIADEAVDVRLQQLVTLLPALRPKLSVIKPALLARLCKSPEAIAQALLELKALFPHADVGKMAVRCPSLVLGDVSLAQTATLAEKLRELLKHTEGAVVDSLVEEYPDTMLDVEGLKAAMEVTERVMPDRDVEKLLSRDPQLIFASQRGSLLIPYDPAKPDGAAAN